MASMERGGGSRQGVSQGGLIEISGPEGTTYKKTFTCCHCNQIVVIPPDGASELGFCQTCHARECLPCARKNECVPFLKKLAAYEARMRLRADIER